MLVGDAFATSCPAAGTGTNKVFNDVGRLCNIYVPRWLASDGMSEGKIAEFYDDTAKRACDAFSVNKAFYLRALSVETGPLRRARRSARFLARLCMGAWRRMLAARPLGRQGIAADTR